MATTDGSNSTMPSPRRATTVFAVPRSTASCCPDRTFTTIDTTRDARHLLRRRGRVYRVRSSSMDPAIGNGELAGVQAVAALRSAIRRFDRPTEQACRECGVTPQWYTILLLIKG